MLLSLGSVRVGLQGPEFQDDLAILDAWLMALYLFLVLAVDRSIENTIRYQ